MVNMELEKLQEMKSNYHSSTVDQALKTLDELREQRMRRKVELGFKKKE